MSQTHQNPASVLQFEIYLQIRLEKKSKRNQDRAQGINSKLNTDSYKQMEFANLSGKYAEQDYRMEKDVKCTNSSLSENLPENYSNDY